MASAPLHSSQAPLPGRICTHIHPEALLTHATVTAGLSHPSPGYSELLGAAGELGVLEQAFQPHLPTQQRAQCRQGRPLHTEGARPQAPCALDGGGRGMGPPSHPTPSWLLPSLVVVQMSKQHIPGDGFGQRSHGLVVLGNDLRGSQ